LEWSIESLAHAAARLAKVRANAVHRSITQSLPDWAWPHGERGNGQKPKELRLKQWRANLRQPLEVDTNRKRLSCASEQRISYPFRFANIGTLGSGVNFIRFMWRKLCADQNVFNFAFRQLWPAHFWFHTLG
jgi:hypothetical protein